MTELRAEPEEAAVRFMLIILRTCLRVCVFERVAEIPGGRRAGEDGGNQQEGEEGEETRRERACRHVRKLPRRLLVIARSGRCGRPWDRLDSIVEGRCERLLVQHWTHSINDLWPSIVFTSCLMAPVNTEKEMQTSTGAIVSACQNTCRVDSPALVNPVVQLPFKGIGAEVTAMATGTLHVRSTQTVRQMSRSASHTMVLFPV